MMKMMKMGGMVAAVIAAVKASSCPSDRYEQDFVLLCAAEQNNVFAIASEQQPDADNMWCAYDRCSYTPRSNPACVVLTDDEVDSCFQKKQVSAKSLNNVVRIQYGDDEADSDLYIDKNNMDHIIAFHSLQYVLGEGPRRDHMDPSVGGARACQAWLQRKPAVIDEAATGFAFSEKRARCHFFIGDGADFVAETGRVAITTGPRNCDCSAPKEAMVCPVGSNDTFVDECLGKRSNIVAVDDSTWSASGLTTDADNAFCAYDRCFEGGSHLHSACKILTDDEKDICFGLPTAETAALKQAAIPLYTRDGSEFGRYLNDENMTGFLKAWGLEWTIQEGTPRFNYMKPSNGALACQSWMQRNNPSPSGPIAEKIVGEDAKYFTFDAATKSCYFLKELPAGSGRQGTVTGPRYCNDCTALGLERVPLPPSISSFSLGKTGETETASEVKPSLAALVKASLRGQANWKDGSGIHALQWAAKGADGEVAQFMEGDKLIQVADWN